MGGGDISLGSDGREDNKIGASKRERRCNLRKEKRIDRVKGSAEGDDIGTRGMKERTLWLHVKERGSTTNKKRKEYKQSVK